MFHITEICPDCDTPVWFPTGESRCETCWRVVPMTRRDRRGVARHDGTWGRLPPQLQGHAELLRSLAATASRMRAR